MTTETKDKSIITSDMVWFATRRNDHTVRKDHPFFNEIKSAVKAGDTKKAYEWFSRKPRIKIVGNQLEFDGSKFDPAFAEAYAVCKHTGASVGALDLFFENLSKNPSPISLKAFTAFTAKTRMPITDRGTFLAYKRVTSDFLDHHTKKFDNVPGSVCTMDRVNVDAVQERTCSTGFHVCSHTYLSHFPSGQDLVVEINPADVVAVPPDYDLSKMRLCSYRVLCTLPYFKKQLLNFYQDALGNLPFFVTEQTKFWEPMEGVRVNREIGNQMSAEDWIASRA